MRKQDTKNKTLWITWEKGGSIRSKVISKEINVKFYVFNAFEDLERLRTGVGVENYDWYQAMFIKRVSAIYPEHGLSFLEKAKASLESDRKLTDEELLARLEEIAPGFIQWAEEVENWSFSVSPLSPQDSLSATWGNIKRGR